jgi:nitrate reductase assembly molybdenum cofactor insertion protein NarJ
MSKTLIKTKKRSREAIVKIPLSSLRCILRYPKEKKMICEIMTKDIKRLNEAETLDEIVNEARLAYALGNYKTFTNTKALLAELHS